MKMKKTLHVINKIIYGERIICHFSLIAESPQVLISKRSQVPLVFLLASTS